MKIEQWEILQLCASTGGDLKYSWHDWHTTRVHTHVRSGGDVSLIRGAVVGGGAGLVHLSQAASLPVLLPPPRERCTAVTGKALLSREGARTPPPNPQKTSLQEDETSRRAQPLCSQPARLQFQTSLDHFSCSPEMNNAHINWCQLINFRLTALYFSIRV